MKNDEVYANDLLDMRLHDVSDLLLQRLCESGESNIKVDLPGCDENGDRFTLRVCLCKGSVNDE